MSTRLLHTPEGVRDIYDGECERKLILQNKLLDCIKQYGYRGIETPTFEYFEIFRKEIGTISSRELYKFFDRDGNTLVLRPDITPSIARACATVFSDVQIPIRLCYSGNTFINYSSYKGHMKEVTQLGAELIGDPSVAADAEIAAMIIDCLRSSGLTEFQLSIGQMDFFKSLTDEADMDEETEEKLRELIINKNIFGVEELVQEQKMKESLKEVFYRLPELFGGPEIFDELERMELNAHGIAAVKRLEQIYSLLEIYGAAQYVSFDLGMLGNYEYYTGVTYRAYTYGTGDYVATGGRYDSLLSKFGNSKPAIGFVIVEDVLMSALERQNLTSADSETRTILLYNSGKAEYAIRLAKMLREKGQRIAVIEKTEDKSIDDCESYARSYGVHDIISLKDNGMVDFVDLITDERKEIPFSSLIVKEGA